MILMTMAACMEQISAHKDPDTVKLTLGLQGLEATSASDQPMVSAAFQKPFEIPMRWWRGRTGRPAESQPSRGQACGTSVCEKSSPLKRSASPRCRAVA